MVMFHIPNKQINNPNQPGYVGATQNGIQMIANEPVLQVNKINPLKNVGNKRTNLSNFGKHFD